MIALKILACIFIFFAFILSLKAKITVTYNEEGGLFVRVLCFKIKIMPKKEKKKGPFSMSEKKAKKIKDKLQAKAKKKALKKKQKKEQKEQEKLHPKPKQKKSLSDILGIISMVKDLVSKVIKTFFKHLKIDLARCHITVATGDAATTAIAYGAICDASLHLFKLLENVKGFELPEAQDFSIDTDFLGDSTKLDIKISFSLRVWHVFHVAFAALGALISNILKGNFKLGGSHKAK